MKKQRYCVFISDICPHCEAVEKQSTLSFIYLSKINFWFQTKLKYGNNKKRLLMFHKPGCNVGATIYCPDEQF